MKVLGQRIAAIGFIVCVEVLTSACGSRSTEPEVPVPPEPQQTQEQKPQPPVAPTPEPSPAPPPAPVPAPETSSSLDCSLLAGSGQPIATVALGDPVDPSNAPRPANDSERLLFRQLYETLITVDCGGHARPGLAASWRLDTDGRTWIVTLRENAYFSDGTPVTPGDVRTSWSERGSGDELRSDVSRLVQAIVPVDDRNIAITLRNHRTDAPLPLAHTDLAIARHTADSSWPLGTRGDGAEPVRAGAALTDSVITLKRRDLSSIQFLIAPGDPRDVLDKAVDLMVTRDFAALDYAATLPQFQSVPLEWQHIHVLLTPGRTRWAPPLSEEGRHVLADDAVRGEARGAAGPLWWQALEGCGLADAQPPNPSTPTPRIVYDARNDVARDLAERLVGLARGSGPAPILDVLLASRPRRAYERAIGLTDEILARALRRGTDAGYILTLNRRSLDPCGDLQVLMDRIRWLDPETIVPLVETRLRAIVRRGTSGLAAEWDGGLLIAGAAGPK